MNDYLFELLVVSALIGLKFWLGRQAVLFPEIPMFDALHRVLQFMFVLTIVWVLVSFLLRFVTPGYFG